MNRSSKKRGFVGFLVGDVRYAVPIDTVREIVNPAPLTEIPHAPRSVVGVADHRHEVVPIIDLRTRFGLPSASAGDSKRRTKWVLVSVDGRTVGLRVDEVTEVFGQDGLESRPAPSLGSGDRERGFAGVVTFNGALTFVLDLTSIAEITDQVPVPTTAKAGAV